MHLSWLKGRTHIHFASIITAAPPNLKISFYSVCFPAGYNFELAIQDAIEKGWI